MYQLSKDGTLTKEEIKIMRALRTLEKFDVDLLSQNGMEVYFNLVDRADELKLCW